MVKTYSREIRESASYHATSRIVNGDSTFGKKDYGSVGKFRSSYEHAFVIYLNELGIKWEYEKYGEKVKNYSGVELHYIPDFYLPEYQVYIEIVNHMDHRLQNKLYWFETQHKYQKLFVLDKKSLRNLFDSKFTIYDVIGKPKK